MKSSVHFSDLKGIAELAQKMVEKEKDMSYPLVSLLLKLTLILPVVTATAFSRMNIIKTLLRNRMRNEWLNDCMVTYIERDISSHR